MTTLWTSPYWGSSLEPDEVDVLKETPKTFKVQRQGTTWVTQIKKDVPAIAAEHGAVGAGGGAYYFPEREQVLRYRLHMTQEAVVQQRNRVEESERRIEALEHMLAAEPI